MARYAVEENNQNLHESVSELDQELEANYFTDKFNPNRKYFLRLINEEDDGSSGSTIDQALVTIKKWRGNQYHQDININFCIDHQNDTFTMPFRVSQGLRSSLGDIITSSYSLIITSKHEYVDEWIVMWIYFEIVFFRWSEQRHRQNNW